MSPVSNAPRRRALWLVLPLVLVPLGLVLRPGTRGPARAEGATPLPESVGGVAPQRVALAAEPAPLVAQPTLAREFLRTYHGARWAELEARLAAAGVDLDQPYVFHPFAEAEPEFAAAYRLSDGERAGVVTLKLDWPAEPTLAWLSATFGVPEGTLDASELPLLTDLVLDLNETLRARAETYAARLDQTLQERFRRGEYEAVPFTNVGLDSPQGFYAKGVAALGWATRMVLTRESCPDLAGLADEIVALQAERDERVRAFLRAAR